MHSIWKKIHLTDDNTSSISDKTVELWSVVSLRFSILMMGRIRYNKKSWPWISRDVEYTYDNHNKICLHPVYDMFTYTVSNNKLVAVHSGPQFRIYLKNDITLLIKNIAGI